MKNRTRIFLFLCIFFCSFGFSIEPDTTSLLRKHIVNCLLETHLSKKEAIQKAFDMIPRLGMKGTYEEQVAQFARSCVGGTEAGTFSPFEQSLPCQNPRGCFMYVFSSSDKASQFFIKVFTKNIPGFLQEIAGYEMISEAHLHALKLPQLVGVVRGEAQDGPFGALVYEYVVGKTCDDLFNSLLNLAEKSTERQEAIRALCNYLKRVGQGLAELHKKTRTYKAMDEYCRKDIEKTLDSACPVISEEIGSQEVAHRVRRYVRDKLKQLQETKIPYSIIHGDSHLGNFFVQEDGAIAAIDFGGTVLLEDDLDEAVFFQWSDQDLSELLARIEARKALGINAKEYDLLVSSVKGGYSLIDPFTDNELFSIALLIQRLSLIDVLSKRLPLLPENKKAPLQRMLQASIHLVVDECTS